MGLVCGAPEMSIYRLTYYNLNTLAARLAIDRSICILTRPMVNTGFNRSLLVDWWSIGQLKKNMVDVKILSISYPILLDSINRLKILSIYDSTGLIENVFHALPLL